jgi:hypothetical protein
MNMNNLLRKGNVNVPFICVCNFPVEILNSPTPDFGTLFDAVEHENSFLVSYPYILVHL